MKLQVEIKVADDAIDKDELARRVRRETVLSLLVDRKISLVQAASELELKQSEVAGLLRQRRGQTSASDSPGEITTTEWVQRSERDMDLLEHLKAEALTLKDVPSIEAVRDALASIPGSMSDVVIAERGEY